MELVCENCGRKFVAGRRHRFCSVKCGKLSSIREESDPEVLEAYEKMLKLRLGAQMRAERFS